MKVLFINSMFVYLFSYAETAAEQAVSERLTLQVTSKRTNNVLLLLLL